MRKLVNDSNRDEVLRLQAELCKSLADPKRLQMIQELRDGEKSVGELSADDFFRDHPMDQVALQCHTLNMSAHHLHDELTDIHPHIINQLKNTHRSDEKILAHLVHSVDCFDQRKGIGKPIDLTDGVKYVPHEMAVSDKARHIVGRDDLLPQPLGDLVMLLLEPASPDSYLQWGFMLEILQRTEYVESYVMEPLARRMLAADPELEAEFQRKLTEEHSLRNIRLYLLGAQQDTDRNRQVIGWPGLFEICRGEINHDAFHGEGAA